MRRPERPTPPATFAGYELADGMSDAERAARVLVAARQQGRRRVAEERTRVEGQQRMAGILERARARMEAQRG